jgi:gas vesicle protein
MRRMFGFLIGVMVGSLVGSTIALLIAPESGDELRDGLRQRGQGFVNQIRTAAQSRRIELQDRLEMLKESREA